jgi:hypothetical protein
MKITTRSLINSITVGSVATLAMSFGAIDQAYAVTFTENFNTVPLALNKTGTVGALTVSTGNVDVIGAGSFDLAPGNGNYIDLNGNILGGITSTPFTFTGGPATLSFSYGSNGTGRSALVTLGTYSTTLTTQAGAGLTAFSTTIANPTNGALSFVSTNAGSGGILIDNISLTYNTAVPEPSDFVGTAIAFGSVVMLKRNFGKKAK